MNVGLYSTFAVWRELLLHVLSGHPTRVRMKRGVEALADRIPRASYARTDETLVYLRVLTTCTQISFGFTLTLMGSLFTVHCLTDMMPDGTYAHSKGVTSRVPHGRLY